jgi:membrane associated rhomboid family serine protease
MFPIRDVIPSKNYPIVNMTLIGINVAVFLYQLTLGPNLDTFVYVYGLVPARYTVDYYSHYFSLAQQVFAFFSFMFLHGGFMHLLGNMWMLYIFGDNVEDHLGPLRYIVFYLLCGIASGVSHLLLNIGSNIPTIGASGAIAGVMGAYFLLHPNSKILTLIPIIIIPWFIEVPAFVFLGIWFVLQFLNAAGSGGAGGGVAWWAHIGGFIFGMVFLKLFDRIPQTKMSRGIRRNTTKKHTSKIQVARPQATGEDFNLYGVVDVTPYETLTGARKLISVPWGFRQKMVRVNVPAGVVEGTRLRLRGMGKSMPGGGKGDLFLKVRILGPTARP